MKKLVASLVVASLLLTGCGQPETINGKEYPTYGLFNSSTSKSEKICYEVSIGNVVWSVLLIETVVMPLYFIGWSLFNPIKAKPENGSCGIDG